MTSHVDLLTAAEAERHASPVEGAGVGTLDTPRGNLPLDSVDVRATVTGLTHRTELSQGFHNPFDEPLEATYIFPLPSRSAVSALRMEADGHVVDGVLKERGEARAEYDRAIEAGQRASIAEEERPGVFTMRVGNILPRERVVVRLTLVGQLPYEDGEATYRFPLVVAPRYIPGTALPEAPVGDGTALDTDAVPDASRITPPVLLPGFPNPIRLTAEVDVDRAALPVASIRSSLDAVTETAGDRTLVRLTPDQRADRDFVLRLRFDTDDADDAVTTALAVAPDADGDAAAEGAGGAGSAEGTFVLTLLPPAGAAPSRPRDLVLVLDRSGSMAGWKMVAARRAAAAIVDTLTAADRFAVLAFDHELENPQDGLVAASDANRYRAVEHLRTLTARGGTEMLAPLIEATRLLGGPDGVGPSGSADSGRPSGNERERALVLVTDGQVGNEDQLLHELLPRLGGLRVHTVGVDTAVNDAFLRRLALLGRGRCELVESEDRLDDALAGIHRRIGGPLVTELELEAEGLDVDGDSISPTRAPDLFAGAPVVVTGRVRDAKSAGQVTVTGRLAGGALWRQVVPAVPTTDAGVAACWARARVRDLEDRYVTAEAGALRSGSLAALEAELVATSVRFGVLCRFTAFVAVDSRVVTEGGTARRVTQPVDLPHGWELPGAPPGRGPGYAMPQAAAAMGMPMMAGHAAPAPMMRSLTAKRFRATAPSGRAETPTTVPAGVADLVRRFLERMRALASAPIAEREALLNELAAALDVADLAAMGSTGGPEHDALRALAVELSNPPGHPAEVDRRWLSALDVLEAVAGPAPRASAGSAPPSSRTKPFWKR